MSGWPKLISFPVSPLKAIIAHKIVLMQTITQEEETESGPKLAPKCQVVNIELSQNTDSAMTRTSHRSNPAINFGPIMPQKNTMHSEWWKAMQRTESKIIIINKWKNLSMIGLTKVNHTARLTSDCLWFLVNKSKHMFATTQWSLICWCTFLRHIWHFIYFINRIVKWFDLRNLTFLICIFA